MLIHKIIHDGREYVSSTLACEEAYVSHETLRVHANRGAVPYIEELTGDSDPEIAEEAVKILEDFDLYPGEDWRSWNWTEQQAAKILDKYQPEEVDE